MDDIKELNELLKLGGKKALYEGSKKAKQPTSVNGLRSQKTATKKATNALMRQFRGLGSSLVKSVQSGSKSLFDPSTGIQLKLLTKKGDVDRRKVKIPQTTRDSEPYMEFIQQVSDMEAQFAKDLYDDLRQAYRGNGNVSLPPLAPKTIEGRKRRGVRGQRPYVETGEFVNRAIKINTTTNIVYYRDASHTPRLSKSQKSGAIPTQKEVKASGKLSAIGYKEIYFINEFGRRDKDIPARPVLRPVLINLLHEYEIALQLLIQKHLT